MRLREREMPLDPEVERELEAIDRALAGAPLGADLAELAELTRELRSQRMAPEPEFSAQLDRRAVEGFGGPGRLENVRRRLTAIPPRRVLGPAAAAATLLVLVGVGISQLGGESGGGAPQPTTVLPQSGAQLNSLPSKTQNAPAPDRSGATAGAAGAVRPGTRETFELGHGARAATANAVPPGRRQIAQRVDLALSTSPDDFRDATDGVFGVISDHRGFVVRSNVSGGDAGVPGAQPGRATYELRIPAGELSGTMGDLSNLGHVVSRTDGTLDITKRFVSARNRIAALSAARDRLLKALGQAVTIAEQQSIRARLRIVEAQLAAARGDLAKAQQRVHLVPLSVTITANAAAEGGGSWTIGDALHDAGRVLTVAAGVTVVAAAALLPLALLIALGAAGRREWLRRQRSRALDAPAG